MIGFLIVFLLVIVFLAFFIGKNLVNVCTIWFFKDFVNISVTMLVFIAFGAGIVFSLLLLCFSHMKKSLSKTDEDTSSTEKSDKKTRKLQKAEEKKRIAEEKKSAKILKKSKIGSKNKEETSVVLSEETTDKNSAEMEGPSNNE